MGCFSFRTFICFYLYHISLTWVCFPPKSVPGIDNKSFLPFDLEWFILTKHTVPAVLCTCLLYTTDFSSGQLYITVSILKWINCPQAVLSCKKKKKLALINTIDAWLLLVIYYKMCSQIHISRLKGCSLMKISSQAGTTFGLLILYTLP